MRRLLLVLFISAGSVLRAQSPREEIKILCSEEFAGRGYVDGGLEKAAEYIAGEFKEAGLKKVGGTRYQPFTMRVNTFPGAMEFRVGERLLKPGTEYLAKASNPSIRGRYKLRHVHLSDLSTDSAFQNLRSADYTGFFLVVDTMTFEEEEIDQRYRKVIHNSLQADGIIVKSKRQLLWTVMREQAAYATFEVMPSVLSDSDSLVDLHCEAKLVENFKTRNVVGMVKGREVPDSFLVITAHYDHLGKMGMETWFPGANDNASGTAMLLYLARHYAKNPQRYSVLFIAFSAEEAGLLGSAYFSLHPLIDLKKIRFLMNLDLEGTGADGITAVNATVFESEFALLQEVNQKGGYLKQVLPRGKAANSDHHWFTEQNVPCFFIYQMGDYGHYHDPGDDWEILPLTAFEETCLLVIDFFSALQN